MGELIDLNKPHIRNSYVELAKFLYYKYGDMDEDVAGSIAFVLLIQDKVDPSAELMLNREGESYD